MKAYIYFLAFEDEVPFYIGQTIKSKERQCAHRRTYGNRTTLHIIEEVENDNKLEIEEFYMWMFASWGFKLTNKEIIGSKSIAREIMIAEAKVYKVNNKLTLANNEIKSLKEDARKTKLKMNEITAKNKDLETRINKLEFLVKNQNLNTICFKIDSDTENIIRYSAKVTAELMEGFMLMLIDLDADRQQVKEEVKRIISTIDKNESLYKSIVELTIQNNYKILGIKGRDLCFKLI